MKKMEIDLEALLSTKQCPVKLCSSRNLTLSDNNRSDASFRYFVICGKCREWVGKIDHHGQLSFSKFTKGRDETTYDNNM